MYEPYCGHNPELAYNRWPSLVVGEGSRSHPWLRRSSLSQDSALGGGDGCSDGGGNPNLELFY